MIKQISIIALLAIVTAVGLIATQQQNAAAFNDKNSRVDNDHSHTNCSGTGGGNCDGNSGSTDNNNLIPGGNSHSNTNCNTHRTGSDCKTNSH